MLPAGRGPVHKKGSCSLAPGLARPREGAGLAWWRWVGSTAVCENRVFAQVMTDVEDKNEWKNCIDIAGVRLPTGYFFGASAGTGDLSGEEALLAGVSAQGPSRSRSSPCRGGDRLRGAAASWARPLGAEGRSPSWGLSLKALGGARPECNNPCGGRVAQRPLPTSAAVFQTIMTSSP